jgi:hypothetical protein
MRETDLVLGLLPWVYIVKKDPYGYSSKSTQGSDHVYYQCDTGACGTKTLVIMLTSARHMNTTTTGSVASCGSIIGLDIPHTLMVSNPMPRSNTRATAIDDLIIGE